MSKRQCTDSAGQRSAHGPTRTRSARPEVIEACLAHGETDRVKAAYNRAQFAAERRALLLVWANFIDGKAPATSNVKALRAA